MTQAEGSLVVTPESRKARDIFGYVMWKSPSRYSPEHSGTWACRCCCASWCLWAQVPLSRLSTNQIISCCLIKDWLSSHLVKYVHNLREVESFNAEAVAGSGICSKCCRTGLKYTGSFASVSFSSNVIWSKLCWFRLRVIWEKGKWREKRLLRIQMTSPLWLIKWPHMPGTSQPRVGAQSCVPAGDSSVSVSHPLGLLGAQVWHAWCLHDLGIRFVVSSRGGRMFKGAKQSAASIPTCASSTCFLHPYPEHLFNISFKFWFKKKFY